MVQSYCLAQGLQKPSSVHRTKLLYELHRHLVWITYTFTEVFIQAFLTKLNFCLQKLRRPELAAYLLLCFSRQPKWLHFSSGNLIATSRTHTHQQTMADVCITARGPQEVNKLQESMAAFSLLTQLLQLHSSARLKLIYASLHTNLCYFRERGFLHWELLPVFFHFSFTLLR